MTIPTVIRFDPVYQTRVWGGRTLETRFGRTLPEKNTPFGESWEISAREEADTVVVTEGELCGKTLTELWGNRSLHSSIFGPDAPDQERFPLLCKILDARQKLSIQVHPPHAVAETLGGEAKSEVWFIADADPGAKLYVGIKEGVTRESFSEAIARGIAEEAVHVVEPEKGDYIFIESGRLHAIGEGLVIYEIQQNSDTTYRVYDWNRMGLDGKPRELHVEESMQCIDFTDIEPELDSNEDGVICDCEHFRLEEHVLSSGDSLAKAIAGRFGIITLVDGEISLPDGNTFKEGDFFMVPHGAAFPDVSLSGETVRLLFTTWPSK